MNLNDKFTKDAIFMFFAASFASLSNLIYQLVLVRSLSEVEYGILCSLISLLLIIAMPIAAFKTMVVKFISAFNIRDKCNKLYSLFFTFMRHNLVVGLVIFLIVLISRKNIANFLNIDTDIYIIYLAVIILLNGISPVLSGFLQGLEKFYLEGSINIISGLIKIIFTFILVKAGYNIIGALIGFIVAMFLGIMLYFVPVKNAVSSIKDRLLIESKELKKMYSYLMPTLAFMLTMTAITNIDMVLVKHYFSPQDSGYYAIAQLIGKILFFIPTPIVVVLFPRAANLMAEDKQHHDVLKKSLFFSVLLCLVCILGYNLFPEVVLKTLTGKFNPTSISLGRLFSIAMSFFGIINVLSFYFLSVNQFKFIKYLVAFTILQTLTILLLHSTLSIVLSILCVSSAALFFIFIKISLSKN